MIESKEITAYTYYSWISLLLTFASGTEVSWGYWRKYDDHGVIREEFFPGSLLKVSGQSLEVIESPYLPLLFQNCIDSITPDIFDSKGLGLALHWYSKASHTSQAEIRFLILCTCLETLIRRHTIEESKRLLPKSIYKEIRRKILGVLESYNDKAGSENIDKYPIFRGKVEDIFQSGQLNVVGNLKTTLQEMLEAYHVSYQDLFPEFDFISIRNDVVHAGCSEANIIKTYTQLNNLIVRLFLSFLGYEGNYFEYVESKVNSESTGHYKTICKTFPL